MKKVCNTGKRHFFGSVRMFPKYSVTKPLSGTKRVSLLGNPHEKYGSLFINPLGVGQRSYFYGGACLVWYMLEIGLVAAFTFRPELWELVRTYFWIYNPVLAFAIARERVNDPYARVTLRTVLTAFLLTVVLFFVDHPLALAFWIAMWIARVIGSIAMSIRAGSSAAGWEAASILLVFATGFELLAYFILNDATGIRVTDAVAVAFALGIVLVLLRKYIDLVRAKMDELLQKVVGAVSDEIQFGKGSTGLLPLPTIKPEPKREKTRPAQHRAVATTASTSSTTQV